MISVMVDGVLFNFRAAAVIVDDGYALLFRASFEDFWSLPGGRVEVGEPSAATVARELAEELGPACDARVERLLWVIENFFEYQGERVHEVGMYYLVTLGATCPYLAKDRPFDGVETDLPSHAGERVQLIYQWFPLDTLANVAVYPLIMRERLASLPAAPELLVEDDG